jgi:hypothetical protein
MVRFSPCVTCVGLLWLTIARGVAADPIHVTGVMNIARVPPAVIGNRVNLSGPGFAIDARVGHLDGYVGPFDCTPCTPGTLLNAGGVLSTTVFGNGTLTLHGITYPVTEFLDSPATLYMELSGSLLAPVFAGISTSVTVPFTMRSRVLIDLAHRATIRGGGTATVFFEPSGAFPDDGPLWSTTAVQYDFSDAAPVPEPATLLMVGGGLAAAAYARRRRRSEHQ